METFTTSVWTPFSQSSVPFLRKYEYDTIVQLKKENPERSFSELYPKIRHSIWRLYPFSADQIKEMYYDFQAHNWYSLPNLCEYFTDKRGQENLQQLYYSPQTYLYNNCFPFFQSRANYNWTEDEDNFLISLSKLKSCNLNFSMLALCIPGRSGKQIKEHFKVLIKKGIIEDNQKKEEKKNLRNLYHSYFLPKVEHKLANEFRKLYKNGIRKTKSVVQLTAKEYYYCPKILADRATFQHFLENNYTIYDEQNNFTTEFNKFSEKIKNDIEINEDGSKILSNDIIRKFNIPEPIFGETWQTNFIKKKTIYRGEMLIFHAEE